MKFGKRFAQALPEELAPFALPYTVRACPHGRVGPAALRVAGSHEAPCWTAHHAGRPRNTRGVASRRCSSPAVGRWQQATAVRVALGRATPKSESAPGLARLPPRRAPRHLALPAHAACGMPSVLGAGARSHGVPAARVVGPLLVGGSQCPVKAPCTGLTPARHHPLPASPQPLKQYLKALVVSAADGTALQGDDSGETSSGGEGYTSGGLLDTSAPSLAFKPTSRQVADFQQRLKGASRLAGRVAGRPV